jgi:hypothetical protein
MVENAPRARVIDRSEGTAPTQPLGGYIADERAYREETLAARRVVRGTKKARRERVFAPLAGGWAHGRAALVFSPTRPHPT